MATYKLIQDIEAEDHILGPLTLRQFIFALIAVFFFYISFIFISKALWWGLVITGPPGLFFGFFAFPWGRDQPTEIWALAKLRFLMVPRRRIWSQSGIKEMVKVNVPKRVEVNLTDGLSQTEVKSRLKALATTIDSRGWSVKNANLSVPTGLGAPMAGDSDRLVGMSSLPQAVPTIDVQASDDIMDEHSSSVAQQFDQMISASAASHREALIKQMNTPAGAAAMASPGWFAAPTIAANVEESALAARLREHNQDVPSATSNLRTVAPLGSTPPAAAPAKAVMASPAAPDPAILSLAGNNDLNVATLAREAYKAKHDGAPPPDEVVISLH
jgi:hypothetical protein